MSTTSYLPDEWREPIIVQRIRDLAATRLAAFTDVQGIFHGTPDYIREPFSEAIRSCERGDFDSAEQWLDITEQRLADGASA